MKKKKYNLPTGYSYFRTMLRSAEFLNNPIKFISKSMDKFSGTYTAQLGFEGKLILTQDAGFINHILKENHKNYHKSKLSTEKAVKLFGNGLLFSNADYWLKQRRLIQPAFHRQKLSGLQNIIIKSINDFMPGFTTGDAVDVYPLINKLSFNIIINSLFNINISPELMDEISKLFSELQDFLIKDTNQPFRRILYPVTKENKTILKKAKALRTIFKKIIEERKSSTRNFNDLLDMFLNTKYEDTGEIMHDEQIIDEVMILIFAGHETTANTLSWLLYLLATNNTILEKLKASIETISIEESLNNEYLKATIYETMRLYPAAWMTERVAVEDDAFDKYSFPKGTIIIAFFFGLHRNKELWDDALKFMPERFIPDPKSKNYFPFGAGPRMCIGNNFAMMEMAFFVYVFLKEFDIKATGLEPEMKPLITLRPKEVVLGIEKIVKKI
ncbi:MAG: cytochrome P450 [Ferruginibacter sp.]